MVQMRICRMQVQSYTFQQKAYTPSRPGSTKTKSTDRLDIGSEKITVGSAFRVLTDRVLAQIKAAVDEARAVLGVSPGLLDTSPEATADRIFNFAVGFFEAYRSQHPELDDETARESFVDLVGGAVQQGIQEARDILTAIAPISESVNAGIDKIAQILENRFTQFLERSVPESALGTVAPTWSPMTM